MDLNREWYSGSTRQITDSSSNMIVQFLDHSLWTDIQADTEKYQAVEWDKSACPWKINYQSDFFNIDWMLGCNAGYQEELTVYHSRLLQERKKGYTFYLSCNGHNNMSGVNAKSFPCWMATLSRSDLDITDTVTNSWMNSKYKELHVVTDFNYDKLFAVPFIFSAGGVGTSFRESLRATWNSTDWSGFGVGFYYKHSGNTARTAAVSMVSLNNKFAAPDWDCTDCWEDNVLEQFDNGLCLVDHTVTSATQNVLQMIGERFQVSGSSGTYYIAGVTYANKDLAGIANYYQNKLNYINGSHAEDSIYDDKYYGGFISSDRRPFERTLKAGVTFDEVKEYLCTQLAYLGFRFCPDGDKVNEDIHGEYFYIPEINDLGVTTGNYVAANSGEAATYRNNDWTTNVFHVTPYDGTNDDEEGDPNTYSDVTDWNDFTQSPTLSFTDMYILDELSIAGLATKFFESLSLKPVDQLVTEYFSQTYLTTEPTDVIVSLRYYYIPLDTKVSHSSITEEILLGTYHTGVSGYNVTCTTARYDYGEHLYYPHFGDFRDYAPYSTAILIIPYCGTVSIDPQEFMGHYVRVQMVVDYATGTCTAYIMKDELVVNSISGQIGIEIPVTAIAGQDLQRNLFNGYQNLKAAKLQSAQSMAQGAMSFLGSAMSSNPLGMAQSVMSTIFGEERSEIGIEAAEYNLQHTQVPFRQVGSINPGAAVRQEQQCRLIIFRPVMDPNYDPVEYGHVTGFATLETGLLSEYTGFTQCSNVILDSLPCTIEEKQSIERLLQSGVYL